MIYFLMTLSFIAFANLLGGQNLPSKFRLIQPRLDQNNNWIFQQVLTQNNAGSYEGSAVALSADGNTLAAGALWANDASGQTQIYSRSGTQWTHQATLTQNVTNSGEGEAIALSSDGNTLAAGSPGWAWEAGIGATQIYVRQPNTTWTYQGTLTQHAQNSHEGSSVTLSGDGNTLAAGAPRGINDPGLIVIYVRSETGWLYQATLTQNIDNSLEGVSVALSADGNTLAAGAIEMYDGAGATQIYIRSGNTWTYQATLSQQVAYSSEGWSVSLSADGNTLAAGNSSSPGATHVYVRSGNSWTYQATVSQNISFSGEGYAVSLSTDGNTLFSGAPGCNNSSGAALIYTRSGTTWAYQTALTQNLANAKQGQAVALSADNSTLATGTYFNPGGTFVYVNSPPLSTTTTSMTTASVVSTMSSTSTLSMGTTGTIPPKTSKDFSCNTLCIAGFSSGGVLATALAVATAYLIKRRCAAPSPEEKRLIN